MPSQALKTFAKRAYMKMGRAEHIWNKAKMIVSKEYDYSYNDPEYWALVTSITKRMMGFNEDEKITFKNFIREETFATAIEMVQHIVDNYNRAGGKNWKAEEVQVNHVHMDSSKPKDCYNNAYRYLLRVNSEAKYVIGFVIVHGVPIEHAWVKDGDKYLDPTLKSGEYIKVAEFNEDAILKFVVKNKYAPSLYDLTKF